MSIALESKARLDNLVATVNAKTGETATDLTAAISALMQIADLVILDETITISSAILTSETEIFTSDKLAGDWKMAFLYKQSIDDPDRQVCWAVRAAHIQGDAMVKSTEGDKVGTFDISSDGAITVKGYSGTLPDGASYNIYWKPGDYRLIVI